MNSKCVKNGKNKMLIIASIILTMAIIMCGNGIISSAKTSKKTSKMVVIQKEIVDGVEIKILADKGVFPQDAKATIKKIDKESDTSKVKSAIENSTTSSKQKIKSVYSYDITIKDSKGNELQPDTSKGEVLVAFKDIKGIDKDNGKNVQVWHVKDDLNKAEEVKNGVDVCNNDVDVKVQHFSIYSVVINDEPEKTIKYFEGASDDTSYFMIEDAEDLYLFRDIVNGVVSDTDSIQVQYENEDENNEKESVSNISGFCKNARLMNNIGTAEDPIQWDTAIGTSENKFDWIFDGSSRDGNSVYNVYASTNDSEVTYNYGLFGITDTNAKININVNNAACKVPNDIENIKYLEGAGTVNSPYLIKTAEDLIYMRDTINAGIETTGDGIINGTESSVEAISACYRLEEDIELNNWTKPICKIEYPDNKTFSPDMSDAFLGKLDGNCKTITFKNSNSYLGLFGKIGEGANINDVKVHIENSIVKNDFNIVGGGMLAGANGGEIRGCTVEGKLSIKIKNQSSANRIGGMVGINSGLIEECYVKNMSINISGSDSLVYVGLLVGTNEKEGEIKNCININNTLNCENLTYAPGINYYFGGFVGYNGGGYIINCYSKSNFIIKSNAAGHMGNFVGEVYGGELKNICCIGDMSGKTHEWNTEIGMIGTMGKGILCNGYYKGNNSIINHKGTGKPNASRILVGCIWGDFTITNLFYSTANNLSLTELIDILANSNRTQIYENIITKKSEQDLLNSLNENLENDYFPWIIESNVNDGYPIMIGRPYYIEDANGINVYGNGYPIIVDDDESGNTLIYFDRNNSEEIDGDDTLLKTLDENGLEIGEAKFNNKEINIYGGIHNSNINRSSKIIVKGGKINKIFGGGKSDSERVNAKVLLGTTIDIQGGEIGYIDANGEENDVENDMEDVKTEMSKIINISNNPIIGTETNGGINIDSFNNNQLNITGSLTGSQDSIYVIKNVPEHNICIAIADNADYAEKYNVFKINNLLDNQTITNKGNNVIIVDTFNALLTPPEVLESSNNITLISGFGDNAAKKEFKWTGKISANPGYVLPNTISVSMGDTLLTDGTDYTWNKMTGEISIEEVTGEIKVTAKAIYVPPIIAVDKPFVSTTDFSYTGTPQSPILIDTDKYTVSVTRETNVGEYTMVVSLKDKVYTRWNDGTNDDLYIKWRINKVDMKVIAKDKSITYGDSPTNAGVSYEGFVNGEDESVLKGTLSYDYDYNLYDNVGNYTITPKGYEADNYNITYTSGTLKVLPKKLSFKWSSPSEFKYDGKAKVMTASIVGVVNNDDVKIASYENNKAYKVGTYIAKVTGITGVKSDNYTLEGASNIAEKWSIAKVEDKKEESKDKINEKDKIGKNNSIKGNKDINNSNNNSQNRPSDKDNSNRDNKGVNDKKATDKKETVNYSNNMYNTNMYDKLAYNNDYKTDTVGAIEGVRTSNNEIKVQLSDGSVISAIGDFEDTVRLMVKEVKNKRKEWKWINNLTKGIGTNKGIYDIFFVNSAGVKVNIGRGTKISILSRERLQKADVYYIKSSSENVKIDSKKEEYTVKFRMIENGYYTLLLNNKSTLVHDKDDDVKLVDKENVDTQDGKQKKKQGDTKVDSKIVDGEQNDNTLQEDSNLEDDLDKDTVKIDGLQYDAKKSGIQPKKTKDGVNWIIIMVGFVIIITVVVVIILWRREEYNEKVKYNN